MELPYDPAVSLLGVYTPKFERRRWNRYLHTNVHSSIIHIDQKQKKPKCPAREEWVSNMWSVPTMRCHPALWKWVSKILTWVTTWVPSLWDLMPDNLRWRWYNNNGNKVHNKCNTLESTPYHAPTSSWSVEKLLSKKHFLPGQQGWGPLWRHYAKWNVRHKRTNIVWCNFYKVLRTGNS